MSKISLAILYTVIGGIIAGMYLEVPYLSGATGAFIVIALVYSFVVAKREVSLMSAYQRQRFDDSEEADSDTPIVPEWQRHVPGKETESGSKGTKPPELRPSPTRWQPRAPASRRSFG